MTNFYEYVDVGYFLDEITIGESSKSYVYEIFNERSMGIISPFISHFGRIVNVFKVESDPSIYPLSETLLYNIGEVLKRHLFLTPRPVIKKEVTIGRKICKFLQSKMEYFSDSPILLDRETEISISTLSQRVALIDSFSKKVMHIISAPFRTVQGNVVIKTASFNEQAICFIMFRNYLPMTKLELFELGKDFLPFLLKI